MDGRVKTLHPKVHGGLLAMRENPEHEAAMLAHGIAPIDLLVVNLYPFEATVAQGRGLRRLHREHRHRRPGDDPRRREEFRRRHRHGRCRRLCALLAELDAKNGTTRLAFRRALAQKAFARTAAYDAAISNWFAAQIGENAPAYRGFGGKIETLRYGENPHQAAAFYANEQPSFGLATAKQVQGKELSYNNVGDTDAALRTRHRIRSFKDRGGRDHQTRQSMRRRAVRQILRTPTGWRCACDPVSAFGGIIALNRTLDAETAREIVKIFTEVIIAPDATRRRGRSSARSTICACSSPAACPIRGAGIDVPLGGRRLSGTKPRQRRVDDLDLQVVTKRSPTRASSKT